MFSAEDSAKISDTYVAVRIRGGAELDDAGRAFMERYGVRGYPTILAMTVDGAVLSPDLIAGRLRGWVGDPSSGVTDLLASMAEAKEKDATFHEQVKQLEGKDDPESLAKLADLYAERFNDEKAKGLYEKALEAGPNVDIHLRLVELLAQTGNSEAELEVVSKMIDLYEDHEDRIQWRLRRAIIDLPQGAADQEALNELLATYIERHEKVLEEVKTEGDKRSEAVVRIRLANLRLQSGDEETARTEIQWVLDNVEDKSHLGEAHGLLAMIAKEPAERVKHLEWILENTPDHPQALQARLGLFESSMGQGDVAKAVEHLEAVIRDFPDSREAADASSQILPQIKGQLPSGDEPPSDEDGEEDGDGDGDG